MKATATVLLFVLICSKAFGQYTSASISEYSFGSSVTYLNPVTGVSETRTVGLLTGRLTDTSTGPAVSYYFLDASIPSGFSIPRFDYRDDITSDGIEPHACWIIKNYYPGHTGMGQLSDLNKETAAIQFAIWHFTDGLNLSSISDHDIRNRAVGIAAIAAANGSSVRLCVEFVMDEDPDYFSIKTLDDNGDPIAIDSIDLSFNEGILSSYHISTTLPTGISERVQVIGANTGIIDAFSTKFVFPKGSIFRHEDPDHPRIFLARPGYGARSFAFDWGTLPVEMKFFTAVVSGESVKLNWSTSFEINNSHFEIERGSTSADWEFIKKVNGNGTTNSVSNYEYVDSNVQSGSYNYRLKQVDFNGNYEYFQLTNPVLISNPGRFELSQNFPNPFNPGTAISYKLADEGVVSLRIFDLSGKQVSELINKHQEAGTYKIMFNADNLPSGIYFYSLYLEGVLASTKKMTLLR